MVPNHQPVIKQPFWVDLPNISPNLQATYDFLRGAKWCRATSFQLHLPSPSCHHQGSSALWYVAAVRVTRYINNIKQHQTFNRGNQTINMTQHYSVFSTGFTETHHQLIINSFLHSSPDHSDTFNDHLTDGQSAAIAIAVAVFEGTVVVHLLTFKDLHRGILMCVPGIKCITHI